MQAQLSANDLLQDGTVQVGAILKAQKRKHLLTTFSWKTHKKVPKHKGWLSCSKNASKVRI